MQTNSDILIIGAGPVGLTLAIILQKAGIDFKIIDKKSKITSTSNAIGVNPRSLEIWKTIGIFDKACKEGLKISGLAFYANNELLHYTTVDGVVSEIDFFLSLPQSQTEQLLLTALNELGGDVMWNTELASIKQSEGLIESKCITHQQETIFRSKWLIGCDSYHSTVRDAAKIKYNCHDLEQHFLMFDGIVHGLDSKRDHFEASFHPHGAVFALPMKGATRLLFEISADPKYKNAKAGTLEIFSNILRERCNKYSIEKINWSSSFYIHECLAEEYIKGNIILAGDAAHSHSPAGGQGMNTGIQDAWNLGWKLTQIIKGYASPKLLETYQQERKPIANDVLKRSGLILRLATANNKAIQLVRNWSIKHLFNLNKVSIDIANQLAQTDIHYETPLIEITTSFIPATKSRIILNDMNIWHIFIVNGTNTKAIPSKIVAIEYMDQDKIWWSNAKMCLVRPDGHIAMYADDIEDISQYFIDNDFNISIYS